MAWLKKLPSGQGTCQAGKLAEQGLAFVTSCAKLGGGMSQVWSLTHALVSHSTSRL